MLKSKFQAQVNVSLFGNRIFADEKQVKMRSYAIRVGHKSSD
jgi:hypothetical protein